MAGKKRSPTLEVSAGQQDERAINLGFDLVSWRGLALAGSLLVSVVLLAGATGNRLATIFGTLMVAGIALDLLLRPTRVTLGPEGLVRRGLRTSHMRYVDIVDVEHGAQQHLGRHRSLPVAVPLTGDQIAQVARPGRVVTLSASQRRRRRARQAAKGHQSILEPPRQLGQRLVP
jgi:hypothetical protein